MRYLLCLGERRRIVGLPCRSLGFSVSLSMAPTGRKRIGQGAHFLTGRGSIF
jgi:hypothetical protein